MTEVMGFDTGTSHVPQDMGTSLASRLMIVVLIALMHKACRKQSGRIEGTPASGKELFVPW